MAQRRAKKEDADKKPPITQTGSEPDLRRLKEPTVTLRLRLRPSASVTNAAAAAAAATAAARAAVVTTTTTTTTTTTGTTTIPPPTPLTITQVQPIRASTIAVIARNGVTFISARPPAPAPPPPQPVAPVAAAPAAVVEQVESPLSRSPEEGLVVSPSESDPKEIEVDSAPLPPAIRSARPVSDGVSPHLDRRRRVKFEAGVRESCAVPQGVPCCVHPRAFKDGKCHSATCRDPSVTVEEVERLLGIKLDQFIDDEDYARMRSRCLAPTSPQPSVKKAVPGLDEASTDTVDNDADEAAPPCPPALKAGPSSRGPHRDACSVLNSTAGAATDQRENTDGSSPPAVASPQDRKVRFGPGVSDPDVTRSASMRCLHPRRLSRETSVDQSISVEEVESLLGIKLDDVVPDPNDPKGTRRDSFRPARREH